MPSMPRLVVTTGFAHRKASRIFTRHAAPRLYRHYTDPRTAKSLRKFPIVQVAERLYPRLMEPALIAL